MKKISILMASALIFFASACSNKAEVEKAKADADAAIAKAEADAAKAKAEAETAKAEAEKLKAENANPDAEAKADADAENENAEEQSAKHAIEPSSLNDSDGALNPKGLVLEMGVRPEKGVETITTKGVDDGIYYVEEIYDGVISFATERRTSLANEESEIQAAITRFAPEARDITLSKDQKMSAQLTYPSWKIEYITGNNEDTRKNVDYYIHTDSFDYRFHTSIGVDQFDSNVHHITAWFENLKLVER